MTVRSSCTIDTILAKIVYCSYKSMAVKRAETILCCKIVSVKVLGERVRDIGVAYAVT